MRLFGMIPDNRDLFMMVVRVGSTWLKVCLKNLVGRGSRVLDFMGELLMIFTRSGAVMVLKLRSLAGGDGSGQAAEVMPSLRLVR